MCGIIGVGHWKGDRQEVFDNLWEIFKNQQHRGTEGAGIAWKTEKGKAKRFRSHNPFYIFSMSNKKQIWDRIKENESILFHHRMPTCSPNKPIHNHPIASEDFSILLIHNGSLMSYADVRKILEKKGHKFETHFDKAFTDTECFVHMIEDGMKKYKDLKKAIEWMANELSGTFALAWFMPKTNDIFLFRHSNPIVISKDDNDNHYFSSLHYSKLKKVHELEDNEFGVITKQGYKKLGILKIKEKSYYTYTPTKTTRQQHLDYGRTNYSEELE